MTSVHLSRMFCLLYLTDSVLKYACELTWWASIIPVFAALSDRSLLATLDTGLVKELIFAYGESDLMLL